ncbi:hypothetical protein OIV83_004044 [Microbotryomycetes sp. JL201]|nr:hypothetical protein OIV83_004044 [Microbotryomycetes sp. JL201]
MSSLFYSKSTSGTERQQPSHVSTFSHLGFPFTTEHSTAVVMPRLDIIDKGDNLVVEADVPGLQARDLDLELREDHLVLSGKEHNEREYKQEDYRVRERMYSSFSRSVPVPVGTKPEDVHASLKDGLLHVTLPKSQGTQRHRIEIKTMAEQ